MVKLLIWTSMRLDATGNHALERTMMEIILSRITIHEYVSVWYTHKVMYLA